MRNKIRDKVRPLMNEIGNQGQGKTDIGKECVGE